MGTDIHFHLEQRQQDGTWIEPDLSMYHDLWSNIEDRHYNLFACLADVRNYNNLPYMTVFRPIPKDLSEDTKKDAEYWGYEDFIYYASLKEFFEFYLQQPKTFIQHGVLVGQVLRDFKEKGIKPDCWCQGYYGDEEHEECEWEEDYHPMDNFMTSLLALAYLSYQKIIPIEDIRTSEKIKQFVTEHGEDIRGIFFFDS